MAGLAHYARKLPAFVASRALRLGGAIVAIVAESFLLPVLVTCAAVARLRRASRPFSVGLGPEPLINNIYHKRALETCGYTAETFVYTDNFISSSYDVNLAKKRWSLLRKSLWMFLRTVFRYRVLFIYFNGGPLNHTRMLRGLEPFLLRLGGVKVVAMPFGGDVQVMHRSPNLYFKDCYASDNPHHNRIWPRVAGDIDRWSRHADWTISGCEWVDYMYQWDTLQLAHFSIDMELWKPSAAWKPVSRTGPFRIFHAPNHKRLKGTSHLLAAVERLKAQGFDVELVMLRGVPNEKIRETIEQVDLVADQFVIGWYAMFALEAMCLQKPVLCYLRPDLLDLYVKAGLVTADEIPLVSCDVLQIEEKIRWAYENRDALAERGSRGRAYVAKHHSTEAIGRTFASILERIGEAPPRAAVRGNAAAPVATAAAAASAGRTAKEVA